MKKRLISIILAISFLFSLVPPVRAEEKAAEPDLEAMVAEQIDAFIAKLKPDGASEGAAQLVKNSIKGGGNMTLTEKDAFGKAIFSSNLFRYAFINAITKTHNAVNPGPDRHPFLGVLFSWYQHSPSVLIAGYLDDGNGIREDDLTIPELSNCDLPYGGTLNAYDEAMMLVAGHCLGRWDIQKTTITDDTITYQVDVRIRDRFDLGPSDYSGENRELEEFVSWVGTLLSFGLLTEFDWSISTTIEITLPNPCTHQTNQYRWEFDGTGDLVGVQDGVNIHNSLSKIYGYVSEGTEFRQTEYRADMPIRLSHDRPWTVEFRCKGVGSFALGEYRSIEQGTYLLKAFDASYFGELVKLNETDNEPAYTHYGINTTKKGISSRSYHTYIFRNHVAEDGSNMVHLYVDGVDLGPMNGYFLLHDTQNSTVNWVTGKDFIYQHIGTQERPIHHITLDYIQISENGSENAPFSYLSTAPVSPTCTADGGTLNTCSLCGAEFLTEVIPATGHDFTDWQTVKEATCTAEGQMERSCKTCGHRESRPIGKLSHVYGPAVTAPTCTESGFTTYTCTCGDSYVADHTDALGHDWTDWAVTNAPTCTDSGVEERWCQRCEYRESRTVDPLGHSYEATVVDAQCTVGGYTEYVCFCGDSYRTNFTNPTGHHYEGVITEPGCTEMGYTTYTCACGDSYKSNFTAPVGHRHEGVVTAPTCTEGGFTTYTCVCGDSYASNYTNALGHEYAEGLCIRCGDADPSYQKPVENPFTDVPEDSFYFSPVLWAVENGITTGASETTFNPGGECMRAHVVTFLWRAAGSPEPSSNVNPFVDVKESDFYYKAVLWAVEKGITNGSDATHFNPFGICNRAQVVTFLYRAFGAPAVESRNNPFTDVPTGGWYTAPVLWAVQNGITNGLSADSFGPNSPCNRAQVVTFLHRAYN